MSKSQVGRLESLGGEASPLSPPLDETLIILNYNYHYLTYKSYELLLTVDKINEFSNLSRIQEDVTDAVQ